MAGPEGNDARTSDAPESPRYRAGDIIGGKYELARVLGEGGMGAVWLARNTTLDVEVAVKLVKREVAAADASERLLQEARAAARLDHPSIVRVFDFGKTDQGEPFIVMEVLEGDSLGDVLDRTVRLTPLNAVRTLLPVISALSAAHAKGIVHRDMKPDNIVLVPDEGGHVLPKVVDFGIAKLRRDDVNRKLTQAGTVLGSPDYMSPEQARGRLDVDHRTDVWALSVILYEAVTGARPFDGPNYNALMMAVIVEAPIPTTELGVSDEALWEIIQKGLAKEVDQRWQSMRALGSALAAWALERGADIDTAGNSLRAHWLTDVGDSAPAPAADRASRIDQRLSRSFPDVTPASSLRPISISGVPSPAAKTPALPVPPVDVGSVTTQTASAVTSRGKPVSDVPPPAPSRSRATLVASALAIALGGALLYTLVHRGSASSGPSQATGGPAAISAPAITAAPAEPAASATAAVAAPAPEPIVPAPAPSAAASASIPTAKAQASARAPKAPPPKPGGAPKATQPGLSIPTVPNF